MAKRTNSSSLNMAAENIGSALGQVAARLDRWKADRASIAADINNLLKSAQGMLGDLSHTASESFEKSRGGRPKGYKMSAATKAKLRAAWKKRKAAAVVNVKATASAAKVGAKAFVKGKGKKADGGEGHG